MTDQPSPVVGGPVALEAPRPTRAEMRRATEAAAVALPVQTSSSVPPLATPSHEIHASAGVSRTEQRRLADESARAQRSQKAIWKAWWLYPLVAAIGVCVYFGIQSAANQPDMTPRVVTTITAQP